MEKLEIKKENWDESGWFEMKIESADVAINTENKLMILVIKPDAFPKKVEILEMLKAKGLHIVKTVTKDLPLDFVLGTMYKNLPEGIEAETAKHFNSDSSEIILLEGGEDIVEKAVEITGKKTKPNECDPETIRAIFGENFLREAGDGSQYSRNAIHRAKDEVERKLDLEKFEHLL
ncbi:MAG: nucleoside-diphosphate kinase [bacterium]